MTVVSPFTLRSMGLVKKGNIPGLSLVNAAEDFDSTPMKDKLVKVLAALGISVAANASDSDIEGAADRACSTIATANAAEAQLKSDKTTLETERDALKGQVTALTNAKTTAEQERDTAKTQLVAERKDHATALVNLAIVEGRLTAAERDAQITSLCNAGDFKVAVQTLAAKAKVVQTTQTHTADLGKQRDTTTPKGRQIHELVNARMREKNESYDQAFLAVQSDPGNKKLFAEMKGPQVKFPKR